MYIIFKKVQLWTTNTHYIIKLFPVNKTNSNSQNIFKLILFNDLLINNKYNKISIHNKIKIMVTNKIINNKNTLFSSNNNDIIKNTIYRKMILT